MQEYQKLCFLGLPCKEIEVLIAQIWSILSRHISQVSSQFCLRDSVAPPSISMDAIIPAPSKGKKS
jgi:hypothetical protein